MFDRIGNFINRIWQGDEENSVGYENGGMTNDYSMKIYTQTDNLKEDVKAGLAGRNRFDSADIDDDNSN